MNRQAREWMRLDHEARRAREMALSRAYPLLKEAAEWLELEAIEPLASTAKTLRQEVGAMLAETGAARVES